MKASIEDRLKGEAVYSANILLEARDLIRVMLEALEIALECAEMGNPAGPEADKFRAAIAKAKGESS